MSLPYDIKRYLADIPVHAMRPWLLVAVLMAALQSLPADWQAMLRFDRAALVAGEAWRLVTANFIHLGWNHLILNVAGFLLIGWLFADEVSSAVWLVVLLA
ncbi:MAG: rhomboid family intramembrane serine protease, partial [Gammaproteobacteria bacterium]|nr:rhomboid family intramembrane serine protease [Gammaproteobacteria bacterium]